MAKKYLGRLPISDSLDELPLSVEERQLVKLTLYKHWVKQGIVPPFEESFTGITMTRREGGAAIMSTVDAEIHRRRTVPKESKELSLTKVKAAKILRARVEKTINARVDKVMKALAARAKAEQAARAKAAKIARAKAAKAAKEAKARAAKAAKARAAKAAQARVAKEKAAISAKDKAALAAKTKAARAAKDKADKAEQAAMENLPRKRTAHWQVSTGPTKVVRSQKKPDSTREALWEYLQTNYMEWVLKGCSSSTQYDLARAFLKGRGYPALSANALEDELRRFRASRQVG